MDIEELDPLAAWDWPGEAIAGSVEGGGLINETWGVLVDDEPAAILQRLNTRIFRPELHFDIEAITRRLEERGRQTPRLLPTASGDLWHTDVEGNVWRCMTWIGDRTVERVGYLAEAESAGRLVARFHAALFDMEHSFHFVRPGAHDTVQHMTAMQQVLVTHRNHRLRRRLEPIASQIWDQWQLWTPGPDLPLRIIHGDLKISNVRFDGEEAVALIDLDTLQWGTLDVELGDALRSWCNTATEDEAEPEFDLDIFRSAMRGYVEGARGLPLTRAEWESLVPGIERISLELASRFARDALEEKYFGWNTAWPSAGEHNLDRARSMADLALSVHEKADEAVEILRSLRAELA